MNNSRGFSLIELLIVVVIIGIIAAVSVPSYLAARRSANEGSAVSSLRSLHTANFTYAATLGLGQFAGLATTPGTSALTELGDARLIDSTLGSGFKSQYAFTGTRTVASSGTPGTFYFSANPTTTAAVMQSGTRRFGLTQDAVIKYDSVAANLAVPFDAATLASALPLPGG